MQNPLVSVIVAVYNKEDYVEKCLNSIICQKYKNIELIIINDGSNDSSEKIITSFISKHNDFTIRYYYQENQGHTKTRNSGIEFSRGEYLFFVDADDFLIDDTAILNMVRLSQNQKCDLILSRFTGREKLSDSAVMSGRECFIELLKTNAYHPTMCSRLIKKEIVQKYDLLFEDSICDDEIWFPQLICNVKNVGYYDKKVYQRVSNDQSVTGMRSEAKSLRKGVDRMRAAARLSKFFSEMTPNSKYKVVFSYIVSYWMGGAYYIRELTETENKGIFKKAMNETKDVLKYAVYADGIKYKIYYVLYKMGLISFLVK